MVGEVDREPASERARELLRLVWREPKLVGVIGPD
jgi:hypothetical protein